MSHPLVLGLFDDRETAAAGARVLHELGVSAQHLSVVASTSLEEGRMARDFDASSGVEIDESLSAARIGGLSAYVVAALAVVLPGIGPIVAAGPLAAEFSEAAGRLAGSLESSLVRAGVPRAQAAEWQTRVADGAVILGAHLSRGPANAVEDALKDAGARDTTRGVWPAHE